MWKTIISMRTLLVYVVCTLAGITVYAIDQTRENYLHIEILLEGLFNPQTGEMRQALGFGVEGPTPVFDHGIADEIVISLHSVVDYTGESWGNFLVYEAVANLQTSGDAWVDLPSVVNGMQLNGIYWVSVRHRNHLETIYSTPIDLARGGLHHCNFIAGTSTNNNALGNNQEYLGEIHRNNEVVHSWAAYVGDINGDGVINVGDRSLLQTSLSQGVRGYIPEDLNGDGIVSISDRSLLAKNIRKGVYAFTPATENKSVNMPFSNTITK